MSLFWFVLFRFGLLPIILGTTVYYLLRFLPLTFDLTAWYGYVTLLTLFVTVGVGHGASGSPSPAVRCSATRSWRPRRKQGIPYPLE
jgi:hypothetical protein